MFLRKVFSQFLELILVFIKSLFVTKLRKNGKKKQLNAG